eukprot:scaffold93901_cov35-Tisochrysis_lutea.AAC.1
MGKGVAAEQNTGPHVWRECGSSGTSALCWQLVYYRRLQPKEISCCHPTHNNAHPKVHGLSKVRPSLSCGPHLLVSVILGNEGRG